MSSVEKNKDFLQFLVSSGNKNRKHIIQSATRKQINSICEIVLNILKGHLPINDDLKSSLVIKKRKLREFITKRRILTIPYTCSRSKGHNL